MTGTEKKFEPFADFDLNFYGQEHFDEWAKNLGVVARSAVAVLSLGEEKLSAAFADDPEAFTVLAESLTDAVVKMEGLKSVLDTAFARIVFVGERQLETA